ncbi:hypothetical protein MHK_004028, partial [Candidatus Magnetomorum sp. HK-1]
DNFTLYRFNIYNLKNDLLSDRIINQNDLMIKRLGNKLIFFILNYENHYQKLDEIDFLRFINWL